MSASSPEQTPALRSARLTLHLPTDSERDAALMLAVLNDADFIAQVRDAGVRDLATAREAVRRGPLAYRAANGLGLCRVVEAASGRDIGQAGLVTRDYLPAPDLGYALLPEARGKGYATEAATALIDAAFTHHDLHRIEAQMDARNSASAQLCERLGMQREAHLRQNWWMKGEWTSTLVYGVLASEC